MFGQAYGAAIAMISASIVLGRAICIACGGTRRGPAGWGAAPLVGLAALLVLADAAIKLPGHVDTAVAVCTLATVGAAGFLLWRTPRSLPVGGLIVGGVALLCGSIPFLAAGRVGPGAQVDNDMAIHLLVAEALRSSRMAAIWKVLSSGYPTGPHSVVAAVGTALDEPLIMTFTGLLLAVVVLTALAAADLLALEALWRRAVIGVLCSLTYLVAAFYGEGVFKETIMAGLLLGFVVHLEQVRLNWTHATRAQRFTVVLPAGLLVAGAIYTYSYLAVAWFGATLVLWLAAEAALRPRLAAGWVKVPNLRGAAPWVAGFLALGVVVLIPIAGDLRTFFSSVGVSPASGRAFATNNLGNLFHPLSPYESFGIWWSDDFRQFPLNPFHAGELSAFAAAVVLVGVVWAVRRRQLVLASAVAASLLIWWYSNRTQSPYVAAKALVIGSPVVMAIALRGPLTRERRPRQTQALVLALTAVFCVCAGYSSFRSLQSEPVQAPEAGRELAAFHQITGNARLLFLGIDDWAPYELRGSPVATLSDPTPTVGGAFSPPNKPFSSAALDFDSLTPGSLDNFPYVITTNTSFASEHPTNFHLITSRRLYQLWKREGPTPAFASIEPPGAPGAVLNCRTRTGRQLAAEHGQAALMATPVIVPGALLPPGGAAVVRLALPAGSWQLSIEYNSTVEMAFAVQGKHYAMPAYVGRPGAYFNVGSVTGEGLKSPVVLRVSTDRPSFLSGSAPGATVYTVAATRLPDVRRLVTLRGACGQYVDWFHLS